MQGVKVETSTDPETRCRLCLHQWTDKDAADRGFQDIFTEEDDSFSLKIRNCLGVFVSPEDSIRTICTNCRETVSLIDEFRSLCRQTEEIYESVQIRCEDGKRRERYGEYVGGLRKLIQEHKDTIYEQLAGVEAVKRTADEDSISQHFVPMQLVKQEPEGDAQGWYEEPIAMELLELKTDRPPSDGEVDEKSKAKSSEGIDFTTYEQQEGNVSELLKKHQVDEDAEDETEKKVDTPLNSQKMTLAKLVYKHQHLWDKKHQDFHNTVARDTTWDAIAVTLNKNREETKYAWKCLKNVYRGRVKRLTQGLLLPNAGVLHEPLFKQLELMCAGNMRIGSVPPAASKVSEQKMDESESDEAREINEDGDTVECEGDENMKLAVLCEKHKIIWHSKHPDHANLEQKDIVWDSIAQKMNLTRAQAKTMWTRLRNIYRGRKLRLLQGNLDKKSHLLRDPLYRKLDTMLKEHMHLGKNGGRIGKNEQTETGGDDSGSFPIMEDKVRLVEEVIKHEFLWNSTHPDHLNFEKREAVWDTIAQEMNLTKAYVKGLWTRLRKVYRSRRLRYLQGSITKSNDLVCDPLYQKLHTMLHGHMQLGKYGGGFPKKDAPKKDPGDVGPFSTMENKIRLVEEVFKHEHLWNTTHVDYFKSDKRSAMWTQIAEMFDNCDEWAARSEWRRLRNKHRPRKSRAAAVKEPIDVNEEDEPTNSDPLFELFSKMAESLTAENEGDPAEEGESSGATLAKMVKKRRIQEITEAYMTHKRRHTGKRLFDNEGCIKVAKGGIVRYEKICELCGKQIDRSYFEDHMNQHNGLKPYVCSFEGCGRQYSSKRTCDRHELLAHHNESYKFECDQCDEKFKYRSKLDYHYAVKHESQHFPCTVCGELLKHKSLLRVHLKKHTGHFPCNVCGKVLQQKYSLDVHMRTHTNEKPYPCEICGQCFMLKVQMKTHLAKVHQLSWEEFQAMYGSTSQR